MEKLVSFKVQNHLGANCCNTICPLEKSKTERTLQDALYDNISIDNSKNDFISVNPSELKYTFDPVNLKPREKQLLILNHGSKAYPIYVLPPDTKYFKLGHELKKSVSPDYPLRIKVTFIPDEIRHYNDILRIRCPGDRNLTIKMSAGPSTKISFPVRVNLGNIPLGEIAHYKIPISPVPAKKFTFAVLSLTEDPCVNVHPLWGCSSPGQNPIEIVVHYRPLRYITMNFGIQIYMPEISRTSFVINFSAYTWPGLKRKQLEDSREPIKYGKELKKNVMSSSVERKMILHRDDPAKNKKPLTDEENLFKTTKKIPLYTLHGIYCVMNTRLKQTHSDDELRGPLNIYLYEMVKQKMKCQAEFFRKAEKYRFENKAARNHHRPKVGFGTDDLSEKVSTFIVTERKEHWRCYENMTVTTPNEELLKRQRLVKIKQRTLRSLVENPNISSSSHLNDDWFVHHQIIAPFIQAARTIILKNRLTKVLNRLKKLTFEVIKRIEMLITKEQRHALYEERSKQRARKNEETILAKSSKK